jgi:hypothetical protein
LIPTWKYASGGYFMNSSIWFADRATHIKIVVVALVAAVVIVGAGISAQTDQSNAAAVVAKVNGPVMRAGKPLTITASDISTVR